MDVTVYTKENCERCEALKNYLDENSIPYIEKNVENPQVGQELLQSEYITNNFCDERGCIVITPIVKIDGTWKHKEFFDANGFSEERARKIFQI